MKARRSGDTAYVVNVTKPRRHTASHFACAGSARAVSDNRAGDAVILTSR